MYIYNYIILDIHIWKFHIIHLSVSPFLLPILYFIQISDELFFLNLIETETKVSDNKI